MEGGRCMKSLVEVVEGRWISPAVQAALSLGAGEIAWEDLVLVQVSRFACPVDASSPHLRGCICMHASPDHTRSRAEPAPFKLHNTLPKLSRSACSCNASHRCVNVCRVSALSHHLLGVRC